MESNLKKQRSDKPYRFKILKKQRELACNSVILKLEERIKEKGEGMWLSRHEILGIITEEFHEFLDEVHLGNSETMKEELIDLAVGCIFGIACIDSKKLDW